VAIKRIPARIFRFMLIYLKWLAVQK